MHTFSNKILDSPSKLPYVYFLKGGGGGGGEYGVRSRVTWPYFLAPLKLQSEAKARGLHGMGLVV